MQATITIGSKRVLRGGALIALTAVAALASSCTNSRLVGVWRDPQFESRPLRSVLVVSQRKDPAERRLWEDAVTARLAQSGVDAVASYTLFPDDAPGKEKLADALHDHNLSAALMMKPLFATNETRWVPGWGSIEPREYYNPWTGRGLVIYDRRWHPGYRVFDRTLREQVTLWAGDDGARMVWAGTVEVDNPSSRDALRRDIADGVVPGLKEAGLL
ncbi:MAG: hypothetical protein HYR74_00620 [Candidatus Eisenbacteria bacterium]|nr:hypothetical protein [Candidatus Eisenbacteria bacterium]